MKVRDLIEQLTDCDPEADVYLAHQPAWPLQCAIGEIVEVEIGLEEDDDVETFPVVYIGQGPQCNEPYLPGVASEELGWK